MVLGYHDALAGAVSNVLLNAVDACAGHGIHDGSGSARRRSGERRGRSASPLRTMGPGSARNN